ncbi:MAG TPA: adenine phosphoribosyltransferase [Gemmatimonadota bacterium]|nr:adenine phosphoribosyltransferase [Gemmatimonadota bacterium]
MADTHPRVTVADEELSTRLEAAIRDIPDFPKPGIVFKDITPVLLDPRLFDATIAELARWTSEWGAVKVIGVDARGFLFAAPVANRLGIGLVPVRKMGKLPHRTERVSYDLEYGSAELEIHLDAIEPGERIAVIDDLLATGGSAQAAVRLVERVGGVMAGLGFVIELGFLNGRARLAGYDCASLVRYE